MWTRPAQLLASEGFATIEDVAYVDLGELAQIEAQYPNEWVLIQRMKLDRQGMMKTGRVLFHSPEKDAVYDRAMQLTPPVSIAVLFMGWPELADDEVFAL